MPDPSPDPHAPHLLDATMFWNPSGGVRRYIAAKRRWAQGRAHWRHTVATPMPDGDDMLAVPSWPLPGSAGAYRLPWHRAMGAQVLRRANPDLIESADPYRLAWSSLDAAQALGVPAVAFCHSNLERMAALAAGAAWGRPAARAARRYARHLYRRFDLVLAPSRAMQRHLLDWDVEAMHQPLGVDTDTFHPARRDAGWRRSLGLPEDARLLVYTGRFAPEKELPVLVEATRLLGARYWLVCIGSGAQAPRGERVIVQAPVRDAGVLAGRLGAADVFVHAGAQETFGLSALEAMACGLPVVARAAEGMAELVDPPVGRAVERASPTEYAAAVQAVFADDREALGAAARRRACSYEWEAVLPTLWQRYRTLLKREEAVAA